VNASYLCVVRNALIFFILVLCLACSNKEEKVLKLDDLVSGSKEKKCKLDTNQVQSNTNSISYFVRLFADSLGIDHNIISVDSSFDFPERFHPIKKDKVTFNQMDLLAYKHWKWSDSVKANQAFFNWLDQFGECKTSLIVGEEVSISKKGFLVLVQDKSIVYLEFGRTFKPEFYLHKLTDCGFGKHWKYMLYQQPLKKTIWIDCISDTTNCPLYKTDLKVLKSTQKLKK
jgi:hypothetical protein